MISTPNDLYAIANDPNAMISTPNDLYDNANTPNPQMQ
jgi:hypothetical protein